MSPDETAAVVHAGFAAINAQDLQGWLERLHPYIEIRSRVVHAAAGDDWFHGYTGAREWWEAMAGAGRLFRIWARYDSEHEAYAAAGMSPGAGVHVADR